MNRLFLVFLFSVVVLASSYAEGVKNYSTRVAWGYASARDFGDILLYQDYSSHPRNLTTIAIDVGYLYNSNIFNFPIDLYFKGGISYFNEDQFQNSYEALVYFKFFYNLELFFTKFRFGLGEGLSIVSRELEAEVLEAKADHEPYSKYLNYLDITIDTDMGKLIQYKPLENVYVGFLLKHRSGVFGTFNGVYGGSNYNSFYIEKNF